MEEDERSSFYGHGRGGGEEWQLTKESKEELLYVYVCIYIYTCLSTDIIPAQVHSVSLFSWHHYGQITTAHVCILKC